MKVQKLFISVMLLSGFLFTGCGNAQAGNLPSGGTEIENSKAIMRLASTMVDLDKIDNLGLSLNGNFLLTYEEKTDENILSEFIDISDFEMIAKINGLKSATKSSEVTASLGVGLDIAYSVDESKLDKSDFKFETYLTDDKLYYDFSKCSDNILSLIDLPKEDTTKFYLDTTVLSGLQFPLLKDESIIESMLSDFQIDLSSCELIDPIMSSKLYDDGSIAIAINITPDTLAETYKNSLISNAYKSKELDETFDLDAALANVDEKAATYKEMYEDVINYYRFTIIFNDNYIEEFSMDIDGYLLNNLATDENPNYSWLRIQSDSSLKFLTGNAAKVNLPKLSSFEKVVLDSDDAN